MKEKQPPVDKQQVAAFRKAAHELGCEDNEERFKDALRTVAKAKPSEEGAKGRPNRSGKQRNA